MVKRIGALLLVLILITGSGMADLKLQEDTPGQKSLKTYISNVNEFLAENGEFEINQVFEQYHLIAEMGITTMPDSEMPEGVTVTVYLYYGSINYLELRVNDASRFPRIAAAFRRALSPKTMTQEESLIIPTERARKALKNPSDSFEDEVEEEKLNGTSPREFYAYYPNQYRDGVNWMQLTIIFPLEGYWDEETGIISSDDAETVPYRESDQSTEYDGYYSSDDYSHLETFTTPTPEPDSAAMEYDNFFK